MVIGYGMRATYIDDLGTTMGANLSYFVFQFLTAFLEIKSAISGLVID